MTPGREPWDPEQDPQPDLPERKLGERRAPAPAAPKGPAGPELLARGREHLVSLTFTSAHDGEPHVVTIDADGVARCRCEAMKSIEHRPAGCWAMRFARLVKGIGVVTPTRGGQP